MSVRPESTSGRTLHVQASYVMDMRSGAGAEQFTATAIDKCGHRYERIYVVPSRKLAESPDLRAAAVTEVLRRLNGAMDECEKNNGR